MLRPLLLLLAATAGAPPARALAPPAPGDELVMLGPAFLEPVLPLDDATAAALARRDHAKAAQGLEALPVASLYGNQVGSRAFVLAWSRVRAGKAAEALPLLPELAAAGPSAPPDHEALLRGEILLAAGQPAEAAAAFAQVRPGSGIWARARLLEAQAHQKAGSTARAAEIWASLADRPDPADGTAAALLALARKAGIGSPAATAHLRRLWAAYPQSAEGKEAATHLGDPTGRGVGFSPTTAEIGARADALQRAGAMDEVVAFLEPKLATLGPASAGACQAWHAYGRAQFKRNNVTRAAEVLVPAGRACPGLDEDKGARSLYIAGKSLERKKDWAGAASAFGLIATLYPGHSMADDGLALAGVAWQVGGQPSRAVPLWEQQAARYADGDLAAEGFWRLAWSAYLAGDTAQAISWAERLQAEVDPVGDPVHWLAGAYWAARWRIWPNADAPTVQSTDAAAREAGIAGLVRLLHDHPTSFYALLASSRLHQVDPAAVAAVPAPAPVGTPRTWTVRKAFLDDPAVSAALQLVRLGLLAEGLAILKDVDKGVLTPSEVALRAEILARQNPLAAHDELHHYLLERPTAQLGPDRDRILRLAFPDTYWDLTKQAAGAYGYDPVIFYALVREESSFNPEIVSWAGARGLSQLMPATARSVGAQLGIKVTNAAMFDPLTNLRIGSKYLDYLRGYFKGNMMLAVPAYNAGEGNVGKWLAAAPDRPTDEFVESIPIRETRAYVKRVLGTYQIYNVVYGTGPTFPNWSAWADDASP